MQFPHWSLWMGFCFDMLQSGEKYVPMTRVLTAAVWCLPQVIPMFAHTCLWCCQLGSTGVPYTRLVFKMFLHLTSQRWWNVLEMVSTLPTLCQISPRNLWCLRQVEEVWVSDSTMIRSRFLLTREEAPPIEISQTFCWMRPNQQRRRQEYNL